jgi:hypothetical protein
MHLFPDTTVLCNFAAVDRMPLLQAYLGGHARWVQAVAAEAQKSTAFHPALAVVFADNWFAEPVALDRKREAELVERFRTTQMFGDPSLPLEHLGESETYVAIHHRSEFENAAFLTDDHDAFRVTSEFGVRVYDTFDVAAHLVARQEITAENALTLLNDMELAGRNLRRVATRVTDFNG